MGLLDRIMRRIMLLLGYAIGSKDIVQPGIEQVAQAAWFENPVRLLDTGTLAQLVAQGIATPGEGYAAASGQGINRDRFAQLFQLAEGPPDVGTLREMFRRGHISEADYEYALRRLQLEGRWHDSIIELAHEHLAPADVANAVQQGFLPNPDLLPVSPPTTRGQVPTRPPVDIDPVKEAHASGVDRQRLEVMARLAGLPPGPGELLEMVRRGIIDESDLRRGIAQGHTKTEWADAYLELLRRPLSAAELAQQVVKEYMPLSEAQQHARAAGVSPEHLEQLVEVTGRPPGPAQLQTAFNRGLIDRARFRHGIAQSDVKTEWVDVLLGLRVRYPTAFALRQLLSSGAIDEAEGSRILQLGGWEPGLAQKVAHAWADGKASRVKELAESQVATLYEARYIDRGQAADMLGKLGYPEQATTYLLELADARRVTRFLSTAVGRLHTLFVSHRLGEQEAISGLNTLGISSEAVDDLMATWKLERDVNRPAVTPAQIAGAVFYKIIDRERGIVLLRERGYTEHDAQFVIDVRLHGREEGAAQL